MWLMTIYGFYSVACADKDGQIDVDMLMIRARVARHLTALQKRFPELAKYKILRIPGRDYPVRIVVPKTDWIQALAEMAHEQTWANFKNRAEHVNGDDGYVGALHDVWEDMRRPM
ncbi:MAG: hypothetical protein NVS1B6_00190 [Steroidobacteraceae bacterium]